MVTKICSHTHGQTDRQTDIIPKIVATDSGEPKTCISGEISTSNFFHENNTSSFMEEVKTKAI